MSQSKIKFPLLLIGLFLFSYLKSQNINSYYFEINTAVNLANKGEIDSSIITYQNAFNKVDYVHVKHLKKVLELSKKSKKRNLTRKYSNQIKTQNKGTNEQLKKTIDSLSKSDQNIRRGRNIKNYGFYCICKLDSNCNKQSQKYLESKISYDIIERTDSLNNHFLFDLIAKNGFIGEELIGFDGYLKVVTILIHFSLDSSNKSFEKMLTRALNNGKIWPTHYAQILDRLTFEKYHFQQYWTYPSKRNTNFEFSESDVPKILLQREKIGIYDSKLWQEKNGNYWIIRNSFNN